MSSINELSLNDNSSLESPEGRHDAVSSSSSKEQKRIRRSREAAFKRSLLNYSGPVFNSIIIDPHSDCSSILTTWLDRLFPEIKNVSSVKSLDEARKVMLSNKIDIIFSDVEVIDEIATITSGSFSYGIISISESSEDAVRALRNNRCGFIKIPLDLKEVAISVQCALNNLAKSRMEQSSDKRSELPHSKLVGIPTLEGIEFINTDEIIRCEGLQKCTVIVTTQKTDVISSYNLGKFKELLEGRGFFSCHRSHFINLKFVKKYSREGYIYFNATSKPVPLARRRKSEFLSKLNHI